MKHRITIIDTTTKMECKIKIRQSKMKHEITTINKITRVKHKSTISETEKHNPKQNNKTPKHHK
jgi:hypothetical protein